MHRDRTTLPRTLALVLPLALAACSSSDTTEIASGIDPFAMDTSTDPCADFYQYACGGFIAANPLDAFSNGAYISRRSQAFFATERVEQAVFSAAHTSTGDPDLALLGAYDDACLGAGPGTQSRADLDAALAQIDAIAGPDDLAKAVAALHALGADALFSFGSTRNLKSPGTRIAYVEQGGIGMPDRSYYLDDAEKPAVAAYRDHIAKLSALAGVNDAALPDAVVGIETQLAQAMLPPDQLREPAVYFNLTDRAAFEAGVPDFSWSAYRAAMGAPAFDALDVSGPSFFPGLEAVLKASTMADLQRYLRWRVIEAFAGTLGDAVVAEEYAFHDGVFYGFTTPLPRSEYCLRLTASALPWTLSRAYVARAFPAATAEAARTLMDGIRDALHDDLAATPWLDAATRAAAETKLAAVRVAVGAPDQWPSTDGLTVDRTSFAAAQAAAYRFYIQREVAKIGAADDDDWFMSPNTVNAAYSASRNAIDFPAAILQAPLFDATFAPAVNYGAMGAIMGHELTHGFDDQGRQFDGTGKLTDWWSPSTAKAFTDRAQCLVDQYDAIEAVPGVTLDGQLTLGENIADLGGVKLAYAALLPVGEDARTFFTAYAQSWCENAQPELLATLARTDPHAPGRARVNAVLANVPEFAEAFSCPAGSAMAPAKRCAVW